MKLSEGIKHKGSPFEIPDCSRDELPELLKELGFKVGAEVGVYKGEYTRKFCKAGLKTYAIDPWIPYEDVGGDDKAKKQERLYQKTSKFLTQYPSASIIREKSMDALKYFDDESLDFVYIDANHRLKFAMEDIYEWSKKVKKGGIISGHDYIHPAEYPRKEQTWAWKVMHAKIAVDAYIQAYKIDNWYVLGSKEKKEGEKRDRCRSFMWFKK